MAEGNPAKRPRTEQEGSPGVCATTSDEDNDEPMEMRPYDQDGVTEWGIDIYLRALYFVTNKALMAGDIMSLVASAKTVAADTTRREPAARDLLQEERGGRRRHLHQAALRVVEQQDVFVCNAVPLLMSVVVLMTSPCVSRRHG